MLAIMLPVLFKPTARPYPVPLDPVGRSSEVVPYKAP
jgi:hypothetical protein